VREVRIYKMRQERGVEPAEPKGGGASGEGALGFFKKLFKR
jgi:hypothetical protein